MTYRTEEERALELSIAKRESSFLHNPGQLDRFVSGHETGSDQDFSVGTLFQRRPQPPAGLELDVGPYRTGLGYSKPGHAGLMDGTQRPSVGILPERMSGELRQRNPYFDADPGTYSPTLSHRTELQYDTSPRLMGKFFDNSIPAGNQTSLISQNPSIRSGLGDDNYLGSGRTPISTLQDSSDTDQLLTSLSASFSELDFHQYEHTSPPSQLQAGSPRPAAVRGKVRELLRLHSLEIEEAICQALARSNPSWLDSFMSGDSGTQVEITVEMVLQALRGSL